MTRGTDPKYERARRETREQLDHESVVGGWHEELKELGEDLNFAPEERQALIDAAVAMMRYMPDEVVDRELERATDDEITKATMHIYLAREDREEQRRDDYRIGRHDKR